MAESVPVTRGQLRPHFCASPVELVNVHDALDHPLGRGLSLNVGRRGTSPLRTWRSFVPSPSTARVRFRTTDANSSRASYRPPYFFISLRAFSRLLYQLRDYGRRVTKDASVSHFVRTHTHLNTHGRQMYMGPHFLRIPMFFGSSSGGRLTSTGPRGPRSVSQKSPISTLELGFTGCVAYNVDCQSFVQAQNGPKKSASVKDMNAQLLNGGATSGYLVVRRRDSLNKLISTLKRRPRSRRN